MTTYVIRWLHLCPFCKGLCRRDLDVVDAPWVCDLHGVVESDLEAWEVASGEDE